MDEDLHPLHLTTEEKGALVGSCVRCLATFAKANGSLGFGHGRIMLTLGIEHHHSESFQRQRIELARKVLLQSSLEDLIVERDACKQSH